MVLDRIRNYKYLIQKRAVLNNHRTLLILYSVNQALHWFAMGIVIPVMVLTLLDLGFNIGQVGIAMAVMSTTVMLLELPTGGLADAIGRKRVYMTAVALYIAGYSLIFFTAEFCQLLAAVVLIGIGRALSSGTIDAWYVDEHKKLGGDDRLLQRDLARAGVVIPAALGAGTLLGGFIPDLTGAYKWNILTLIAFYILQLVLTSVLIKEDRNAFSGSISAGFKAFPAVLSSAVKYGITKRNTMVILTATAALGIGLSGLEQLWQPRVKEIAPDSGTWFLGVLAAGYFLAAAGGNAVSTVLLKLFNHRYRLVLFLFRLLMAGFYLVLASVTGIGAFAPVYFLLFFAHGVTGSPEMTVFNRDIPSSRRSSLLSLNSLFLQAGGAAGSVAAGLIALRGSISAAWAAAGLLLGISSFAYLLLKDKKADPAGT